MASACAIYVSFEDMALRTIGPMPGLLRQFATRLGFLDEMNEEYQNVVSSKDNYSSTI